MLGVEINGVRTASPPREKLGRGIEWKDGLFQLHQPIVKAG